MFIYHSFTLEKSGRGFKTVSYRSSVNKPCDHFGADMPIMAQHTTLAKIKKDFAGAEHLFTCVVEEKRREQSERRFDCCGKERNATGNFTVPTTLIQLVVECDNQEQYAKLVAYYEQKQEFLTHTVHTKYKWLDEIDKTTLTKWLEF